jgi:hypothetical protein
MWEILCRERDLPQQKAEKTKNPVNEICRNK